jgi:hypothetical protein
MSSAGADSDTAGESRVDGHQCSPSVKLGFDRPSVETGAGETTLGQHGCKVREDARRGEVGPHLSVDAKRKGRNVRLTP